MFDSPLLPALVWTDYRLAVLFTVLVPLCLLVWAFVLKNEPINHVLTIYWKVASLLAITVYLMIGGFGISFLAALLARLLIPISLWFWVDLNEEIREQPGSPLKLVFGAWRWAVTLYNGLGLLMLVPFVPCAFSSERLAATSCQVWRQAPLLYREYFHSGYTNGFLGFFGILGLIIYVGCLAWFVFVRLGKQGRQAIN